MFAAAIVTDDHRPDAVGHKLLWLLRDVRPWLWYVATAACFVLADQMSGWASLLPVMAGLACGLYGLTSFNHGHDGLSKYRQ